MKVYVLRIGHRPERDKRITTHVALVARAFGASGFLLNPCDEKIIEKIRETESRWGRFLEEIECVRSPLDYVRKWKESRGKVVHLTMYGMKLDEAIEEIKDTKSDLLLIVGAEKVPREYYDLADWNVSVGNQPHSEVAALAVFLDRLFDGKELYREPANPQIKIVPSRRGKRVVKGSEDSEGASR
ncbi:tRNA methyltransferase [Ignicoccus islandicus DSM 13165]|uniref:tRNA (cytidine(56)-2'-O)-methyltransferase n=1 Tax=Ignicoccus islandicus DSM 13165 TaxID=940295 RepID=A0A0U3FI70_9CREN|nr:tRNA (cytidine(56)-2'-O)-methyltransferase [Ignicoccus islandicus]ALU11590.1 tRNA methyltransferase [Ignicoccus islandicus DSM 13165]